MRPGRWSSLPRLTGVTVVVAVAMGAVGYAVGHATAPPPAAGQDTVSLSGADMVVPGAPGHHLVVTLRGGTVLVRDAESGLLLRVDGGRLALGPAGAAGQDSAVFAGANATYQLDYTTGTVTLVDPATRRPLASAFHLDGLLGRQATVTPDGTLWVPVLDAGTVVPVTGTGVGRPARVAAAGSSLAMTVAAGMPVVVDQTAGTLVAVRGGRTEVTALPAAAAGPGTALLVPATATGARGIVPVLATGASPSLVFADPAHRSVRAVPLGPAVRGHQLGAPVQAGTRVYVPDFTAGTALAYDSVDPHVAATVTVTGRPGTFDIEVKDGVASFSTPGADTGEEAAR